MFSVFRVTSNQSKMAVQPDKSNQTLLDTKFPEPTVSPPSYEESMSKPVQNNFAFASAPYEPLNNQPIVTPPTSGSTINHPLTEIKNVETNRTATSNDTSTESCLLCLECCTLCLECFSICAECKSD